MGEQVRPITQQPKHGAFALLLGPLRGDSDWGNSNPDVFTDSSGYRGFRHRLGIRSVGSQDSHPNHCPALSDAVEVSGGEAGPADHHHYPL